MAMFGACLVLYSVMGGAREKERKQNQTWSTLFGEEPAVYVPVDSPDRNKVRAIADRRVSHRLPLVSMEVPIPT